MRSIYQRVESKVIGRHCSFERVSEKVGPRKIECTQLEQRNKFCKVHIAPDLYTEIVRLAKHASVWSRFSTAPFSSSSVNRSRKSFRASGRLLAFRPICYQSKLRAVLEFQIGPLCSQGRGYPQAGAYGCANRSALTAANCGADQAANQCSRCCTLHTGFY